MNLRGFHLLFITLSVLLTLFLAVWAFGRGSERTVAQTAIGMLSIVGAVALTAYGIAFRRKSRYW